MPEIKFTNFDRVSQQMHEITIKKCMNNLVLNLNYVAFYRIAHISK